MEHNNNEAAAEKIIATLPVWIEKPNHHAGFGSNHVLGHFTVNMKTKSDKTGMVSTQSLLEIPKVVTNYGQLIGFELPDGKDQTKHNDHAKEKQRQFFKWVEEKYKLSEEENEDQPDIICSGGLLGVLLGTPLKIKDQWDFYATKIRNSAILWFEPKQDDGYRENSLPGILFEALVTGADTGAKLWDSCYMKDWIIHRQTFGDLSILLVSDVDAVDQDGSWVEVKLFEKWQLDLLKRSRTRRTDKLTNSWSQLVANNVQKLLYGVRVKETHHLAEIQMLSLDEFERMLSMDQKKKRACYSFLNRILEFVQTQLSLNQNKNQVLQFRCSSTPVELRNNPRLLEMLQEELKSRKVECLKVKTTPEWFKEHREIFGQNHTK